MDIPVIPNRAWTFRRREPTKWSEVVYSTHASVVSHGLNPRTVAAMLYTGVVDYAAELIGAPVFAACFKYFLVTARRGTQVSNEAR